MIYSIVMDNAHAILRARSVTHATQILALQEIRGVVEKIEPIDGDSIPKHDPHGNILYYCKKKKVTIFKYRFHTGHEFESLQEIPNLEVISQRFVTMDDAI